MSLENLLDVWREDPHIIHNVATWRTLEARPAQLVPFPRAAPPGQVNSVLSTLHPALMEALQARGISALYTHQATAWQLARANNHFIVVTGTASGKTLCYNLPVLDRLLRDPHARALYLFPTKALAQDQHNALTQLLAELPSTEAPSIQVATYDGDTSAHTRRTIREKVRLAISNPDMLHVSLLPHHTQWADFFRHLAFVVIDETHIYRGVFGSHVANVLRRLKRIARFYGASPQFILTSATIGNPVQLAELLIEEPVSLVDDDGAAKGTRHFLIYNPPITNPDLGIRQSMLLESVHLAQDLVQHDVQTLVFARTRQTVELILGYLRREGSPAGRGSDLGQRVRGYRSGYLPRERREIERRLREGQVRVVIATTALELGVDIGGMGAVVLSGYPGTISGTWQQAGRAGRQAGESSRSSETSLAVMVASANPLDQFLAHHPDYFFRRTPEHALISPDNPLILLNHLRCAAFELPFEDGEGFGRVDNQHVVDLLRFLQDGGILHRSGNKYYWMADQYPSGDISLRTASPVTILVQTRQAGEWKTFGHVDGGSAHRMLHPGAIYLHEGRRYQVRELDLEGHTARLLPADVDYYTQPLSETTVQLLQRHERADASGAHKAHGEIAVTTQVTGFRRIRWFTHERLGTEKVTLPPTELLTTAYWLALRDETVSRLRTDGLWTNDPNDYGPDWIEVRDRARARDGHRCQVCDAPEEGQAHHVHHVVPLRAFESFRQANRLSNLTTLCSACHRRAELSVRMRSGLAGLAFAMGNMAPLFLMCDPRDIGVHTDPKSSFADGLPTVLVYDQVPAGIGLSERIYELHDELMGSAHELVATCTCVEGCPSCVGPAGENGQGGKRETLALLEALSTP